MVAVSCGYTDKNASRNLGFSFKLKIYIAERGPRNKAQYKGGIVGSQSSVGVLSILAIKRVI